MKSHFEACIGLDGHALTPVRVALHISHNPNERRVSEFALYCHAGPDLYPTSVHYEMEITDKTVEILGIPKPFIHAVKSDDGKYFICYPNKMETEDEAERIFRIWALGTIASMIAERDVLLPHFNPSISVEDFSKIMMEEYGVRTRIFKECYL